MKPFLVRTHRITWGECDPAGIVFAPRYFDMFTESTILLFEAAGLGKKRAMLEDLGTAGFPLVSVEARFHSPTTYGDEVTIETMAPQFRRSSFSVEHRLLLDGTLCVECTEQRVWAVPDADRANGIRAEAVPERVRAVFEQSPNRS